MQSQLNLDVNKRQLFLGFFLFILFISLVFAISIGSFETSFWKLLNGNLDELQKRVLFQIRLPRVVLAAFVGASLAFSGSCLQGLFRNPLADPGLIGVSSGAALGAASSIVLSNCLPTSLGLFLLPSFAILGSFLVIILLFIITKGFGYNGVTYMLLAGIAINAISGVGIGILTYISDDVELRGLTFWTMGSFGSASWKLILPAIVIIFFTILFTLKISRKLDLIQLGEIEASRLGVDIKKLKKNIILSSAIIVGVSVSLTGMIGFVGLIVPHMVRLIIGVNHKYLLQGSIVFGAFLMVLADLISRIIISPAELPVGLITSAIGAPFFLWLIFNMKKT